MARRIYECGVSIHGVCFSNNSQYAKVKNRYGRGNVAALLTIFNYFMDEQNESNDCVNDAVGCNE